jgi:hypothetical protein
MDNGNWKRMSGFGEEFLNRITDYPQSFIPLIVEKISFIDRDMICIEERNLGE